MKIFFIGMPGSGKTTMAKSVAEALQMMFVDLDHEIVDREQKSIPEIFRIRGEEYFRQVESKILTEWATKPSSYVMATGGGAPCFHAGIDIINKSGISIFLNEPLSTLVDRVSNNTDRPLLATENVDDVRIRLQKLFILRESCYRQAQIIIDHPTLEVVLERLRIKK